MEADPRIELTLDLARQDLANQFGAVDELRARVGSLIAAAAIATSFLSAQTFTKASGFPAAAWVGATAAASLIGVCVYILWPRNWQGDSVDTTEMLASVDSGAYGDIDQMCRTVAYYTRRHYLTNRGTLRHLYRLFIVALALLVIDFGAWFAALIGA